MYSWLAVALAVVVALAVTAYEDTKPQSHLHRMITRYVYGPMVFVIVYLLIDFIMGIM